MTDEPLHDPGPERLRTKAYTWRHLSRPAAGCVAAMLLLMVFTSASGDTLESTTGASVEGRVIARDDKFVTMEVQVAGKPVQRKFPLSVVRALTINGKREVLQGGGPVAAPAGGPVAVRRTPTEVNALIAKAAAPPDWLAAT